MDERRQSVEAMVGVLMVLGLVAIGYLVVKYGKIRNKMQEHYRLTVEMQDATGIRQGVPVRLGGVLIGQVAGQPQLKSNYLALEVPLDIYKEIKIPQNALVTVAASGLMGDNYVKFTLPSGPTDQFLEPGTSLQAGAAVGLKALQSDAEGVLNNVNKSVSDLNGAIASLDRIFSKVENLLDSNGSGNLEDAISDLSDMAKTVKEASLRLDPLFGEADEAIRDFRETAAALKTSSSKLDPLVASADETIAEIKGAAIDARKVIGTAEEAFEKSNDAIQGIASAVNRAEPTMEEIEAVLKSFRNTLAQVDQLASATAESEGLIKALWDDPELKRDFKNLVNKLESNGVIFYPRDKDRPKTPLWSTQNAKRN